MYFSFKLEMGYPKLCNLDCRKMCQRERKEILKIQRKSKGTMIHEGCFVFPCFHKMLRYATWNLRSYAKGKE